MIISLDVHVSVSQATMLFAELTYTLATEEAERIGVDHVARMTATGTGENSTGNHSNDRRRVLGSLAWDDPCAMTSA